MSVTAFPSACTAAGKKQTEMCCVFCRPIWTKKLSALWEEFEAEQTPEAKFARTMDNIQPMMLNAASDGKSWVEHGVQLQQILQRNAHTAEGSQELWEYCVQNFLQPNLDNGHIQKDGKE